MAEVRIRFDLSFSRRFMTVTAVAAILFCSAPELDSEIVTLSTYYPAPSGVYTKMITTGDTYLARDSGTLTVGPLTTSTSSVKLALTGVIKLAGLSADPTTGEEGSIYYNTTDRKFRAYQGNPPNWSALSGGSSRVGSPCGPDSHGLTMYTPSPDTLWCCSPRALVYDSSYGSGYYTWLRCIYWSAPGDPTPSAATPRAATPSAATQ